MGEANFSDAIKKFIDTSRLKTGVRSLQLTDTWEALMGKTIAKYTDKLEIVNKTLFIHTTVAPLKQELQYQKARIVEMVNESMGAGTISEVVIR